MNNTLWAKHKKRRISELRQRKKHFSKKAKRELVLE